MYRTDRVGSQTPNGGAGRSGGPTYPTSHPYSTAYRTSSTRDRIPSFSLARLLYFSTVFTRPRGRRRGWGGGRVPGQQARDQPMKQG